jgi:hypothetical protein
VINGISRDFSGIYEREKLAIGKGDLQKDQRPLRRIVARRLDSAITLRLTFG